MWLDTQKLTSSLDGWIHFTGGTGYYDIHHFEDTGILSSGDDSLGVGILCTGGTLNLFGGIFDPIANGGGNDVNAISVSGGTLNLLSGYLRSGASAKDLVRSGGTLNVGPAVVYDAAKTTGPITKLNFYGKAAPTDAMLDWFSDPTSAKLRTAMSDETGTSALVFAGGNIGAATGTTPSVGDNDTSVATTAFVGSSLPKRFNMKHQQSHITAGNAATAFYGAGGAGGEYFNAKYQSTPANGDKFTNSFICAAGTYTLEFIGQEGADRGSISAVSIDGGATVGTVDFYHASSVGFVHKTIASVVLTAGYHTIECTVGKNASSSNYFMVLSEINGYQAAD